MSEGAKVGTGIGLVGILSQVWEALTQAPEHLLDLAVKTLQRPSFWLFAGVVGVGAYIWWRRRQMKKDE
jgi:bacteriorhodopsin